uniref:Putative secreted protein n=1 Tax=Ixodes ricinus TaxID=34613 RepID=V5HQK7_IXORI
MVLAALLVESLMFLVQWSQVLRFLVLLESASWRHPRHVLLRQALTELFVTFLGLQTRLLFHLMVQVLHSLNLGTAALCQTPVRAANQQGSPVWIARLVIRLLCMSPQWTLRMIGFLVLILTPRVRLRLIQSPRPLQMQFLVHHHAPRHHT